MPWGDLRQVQHQTVLRAVQQRDRWLYQGKGEVMNWRDKAHYISSTDITDHRDPHVTVQWDDDDLTEITVTHLGDDGPLTLEEFQSAWQTAHGLKAGRERSGS